MPLGKILRPAGVKTPVEQTETYDMLGVKSFAKGAFASGTLSGVDTAYPRLIRTSARQVVYPKLMAWEGAFAVIPDELGGRFVSPEFLCFDVDEAHSSHRYIKHLLAWSGFSKAVRGASTGTNVRRQRLQSNTFLEIEMPVPPRPEQDRIADHLDSLERAIAGNSSKQARNAHTASEAAWIGRFRQVRLSDLVEVGPRPERLAPDFEVAFVPMSAVSAKSGTVDNASYRSRNEVGGGYRQFRTGDIIFARITPSMQNGKSAIFDDSRTQVGYGSTEFHVLRPYRPETTVWLWAVLRTRWFRELAAASFTGTAGQQRVPAAFLENALVPLPDDNELVLASDRLVSFQETLAQLESAETKRNTLAAAILPAARNEIFAAMR